MVAEKYPRVAKVAQCHLSAPSTSVASELLFSTTDDVYNDTRSQLAPERAEMLLFIRENFTFFE
jgi:hAT family C-terminal dimerisation region